MTALILYYLICYGLTMIIVQSLLMKPLRTSVSHKSKFFGNLISCMTCTGFWVCLLASVTIKYSPVKDNIEMHYMVADICAALAGTTIITFIYLFQIAIEKAFDLEW